jgi:hypothetical protein
VALPLPEEDAADLLTAIARELSLSSASAVSVS